MSTGQTHFNTVIIGAGAAGLMCGAEAAANGGTVLIIDHADEPGEKIRISGGGRCNFTNIHCGPDNFISENPHYCRSALSRYSPQDFIDLVERFGIAWHEKTKGQLFCDGRSQDIIDLLLSRCEVANNQIWLGTKVLEVRGAGGAFQITTDRQSIGAENLVIATGGLSIPKMGATDFGYRIARQYGLEIVQPEPALVPLTITDTEKAHLKTLAGVSTDVAVSNDRTWFEEALLFTHRGISGPAILQISSYWEPGEMITINLAPGQSVSDALKTARQTRPKAHPKTLLSEFMPKRLAEYFAAPVKFERIADMSDQAILNLAMQINQWMIRPAGSEGFRTAEVTRGGINTRHLSSKTMASTDILAYISLVRWSTSPAILADIIFNGPGRVLLRRAAQSRLANFSIPKPQRTG